MLCSVNLVIQSPSRKLAAFRKAMLQEITVRSKRFKIWTTVIVGLVVITYSQPSLAMPAEFHGQVVRKAIALFIRSSEEFWSRRTPGEVREASKELWSSLEPSEHNIPELCIINLPDGLEFASVLTNEIGAPTVVIGAVDEDFLSSDSQWNYKCDDMFWHHAWDPDTNKGWLNLQTPDTSLEWANYYFQLALDEYAKGHKAGAYYLLGLSAHLLGDAATPAHIHGDPHDPINKDGYEDSLNNRLPKDFCQSQYNCQDCSSSTGCEELSDYTQIRSFDDFAAKYPDASNELKKNYQSYYKMLSPVPLYEELWEKGPKIIQKQPLNGQEFVDPDLFHIFYYAAEKADDCPSTDRPGEKYSTLEYEEIGKRMVPVAIHSTVALMELFWDKTHSYRILTSPKDVISLQPGGQTTVYLDIQNVGLDPWPAGECTLENVGGDLLGAQPSYVLDSDVPRGRFTRFELPITAPLIPGKYHSEWQLKRGAAPISSIVYLDIYVLTDNSLLLDQWSKNFTEKFAEIQRLLKDIWASIQKLLPGMPDLKDLWEGFLKLVSQAVSCVISIVVLIIFIIILIFVLFFLASGGML